MKELAHVSGVHYIPPLCMWLVLTSDKELDSQHIVRVASASTNDALVGPRRVPHRRGQHGAPATSLLSFGACGRAEKALQPGHARPRASIPMPVLPWRVGDDTALYVTVTLLCDTDKRDPLNTTARLHMQVP